MVNSGGSDRMRNPYQNRKAIKDPGEFFGRKEEVNEIFALLSGVGGPQSIEIVGERKIGKSSLLYFIKNKVIKQKYLKNPDEYMFVYLELGPFVGFNSERFCEILLRELSSKSTEEIPVSSNNIFEVLEKFIEMLCSKEKKIIFMFDEFDSMLRIPAFDSGLLDYFRSLSNKYSLSFITCSRIPIEKLTEIGKGSPFFNIFHKINLRYFEEEEALELIEKPSSRQKIDFSQEDVNFINEVAYLHPFFIQIVCYHLFNFREEKKKQNGEELDKRSYDLLYQKIYDDTMGHWSFYLDHMDEYEKEVFLKICKGEEISDQEDVIVYQLYNKSLIYMKDGNWRVFSSVFHDHTLRKKEIIELEKESGLLKKSLSIEQETKARKWSVFGFKILGGVIVFAIFLFFILKALEIIDPPDSSEYRDIILQLVAMIISLLIAYISLHSNINQLKQEVSWINRDINQLNQKFDEINNRFGLIGEKISKLENFINNITEKFHNMEIDLAIIKDRQKRDKNNEET